MIEVQNVSMRFNLGIEKNNSLKQMAVDLFNKKARENKKKNNEFWALQDVNFKVEKGEVLGFVGSNGAGKSTLLKIVAGVMKPTKGKVLVGGNICPMIELGAGFDLDLNARENIYLYVSHSIKSIESLCDRVVWLEHGKVVMVGKTDEVCKAYYASQMEK